MRVRRSWVRTAAGLVAVVAVGGLAACSTSSGSGGSAAPAGGPTAATTAATTGGGPQAASPAVLLQTAYAKTSRARTARVALREQISEAGSTGTVTGDGVEDFAAKASLMTLHVTAAGQAQTVQMRTVGTAIYYQLPAAARAGSGGKEWLELDIAKISPELGQQFSQSASDPAQGLSLLKSKARSVTRVGTESVRGTPTTHYRAVLDLNAVLAAEGPKLAAASRQAFGNRTTLSEDVWIDGQGRARRFSLPLTQNGVVGVQMEMYDFGVPVSVAAPPASQTTDGSGALGNSLGG